MLSFLVSAIRFGSEEQALFSWHCQSIRGFLANQPLLSLHPCFNPWHSLFCLLKMGILCSNKCLGRKRQWEMKNDYNVIEVWMAWSQSERDNPSHSILFIFNPKLRVSVEQGPQTQKPKAVLQLHSRLPETRSGMIGTNTRGLSGRWTQYLHLKCHREKRWQLARDVLYVYIHKPNIK